MREIFAEHLPYYLSIGMTWEQFYHGDVDIAPAYRKAQKLRESRKNEELWLQGAYFYDALCAVAPILRAFSKATSPLPYPAKPYPIQGEEEESPVRTEKGEDKALSLFSAWAIDFNANFKKGGVDDAERSGSRSDIDSGIDERGSSSAENQIAERSVKNPQEQKR